MWSNQQRGGGGGCSSREISMRVSTRTSHRKYSKHWQWIFRYEEKNLCIFYLFNFLLIILSPASIFYWHEIRRNEAQIWLIPNKIVPTIHTMWKKKNNYDVVSFWESFFSVLLVAFSLVRLVGVFAVSVLVCQIDNNTKSTHTHTQKEMHGPLDRAIVIAWQIKYIVLMLGSHLKNKNPARRQ